MYAWWIYFNYYYLKSVNAHNSAENICARRYYENAAYIMPASGYNDILYNLPKGIIVQSSVYHNVYSNHLTSSIP